jgi:hypothetical protein
MDKKLNIQTSVKYPEEYSGFIKSVKRKAVKYGVKLKFGVGKLVYADDNDKDGSSGYFWGDTQTPELSVAVGLPIEKWMICLIHESCHMDQHYGKNKSLNEIWDKSCVDFFEWLAGRRQFNNQQLDNIVKNVIDLELDCEKRSVEKIKKWGLPLDEIMYIQKANTYLYGYLYVRETKKWYNDLYNNDKVWVVAPKELFDIDHYSSIPPKMRVAFNKHAS